MTAAPKNCYPYDSEGHAPKPHVAVRVVRTVRTARVLWNSLQHTLQHSLWHRTFSRLSQISQPLIVGILLLSGISLLALVQNSSYSVVASALNHDDAASLSTLELSRHTYSQDGFLQDDFLQDNFLQNIVEIVAGDAHSCGRNSEGAILCWGDNEYGQLGDGTTRNRAEPVPVLHLPGIVQSTIAGGNHTCAVVDSDPSGTPPPAENNTADGDTADGDTADEALEATAVYCWGSNDHGQLGNGTTENSTIPVLVSELPNNINALAAGESHTCALTADGAVYCWGKNNHGQLGNGMAEDGSLEDSAEPVPVIGLDGNLSGELSEESSKDSGEEGAVSTANAYLISAGGSHSCAATAEEMRCWGNNEFGQLGDGTTEDRAEPTAIAGPSVNVLSIGLGRLHTCALAASGVPFCWGSNFYGQLGIGTSGIQNDKLVPTQVKGEASKLATILSHGYHTCALSSEDETFCWGFNLYGQVGDGSEENRSRPTLISFSGRGSFEAVATGHNHTCGIFNGQSLCWGHNFSGQIGDGSQERRNSPTVVTAPLARTFLSYVAQPDSDIPTPTPVPPPRWERIGQSGLRVRTVEVIPQQASSTLLVGILEPGIGAKGLYRGAISAACNRSITLVEAALEGSVMDIQMLGNAGVLANYDRKPHYTTDQGQNWIQTTSDIQIQPYSVTYDTIHGWFVGADEGLFRSQDNGVSWKSVENSNKLINVVKAVDGVIWIGTADDGLYAYDPVGQSFTNLTPPVSGVGSVIWDILPVSQADGSRTYFLATSTGVYQGAGSTEWTRIGGAALADVEMRSLAVAPSVASDQSARLYVGTTNRGVWQISLDAPNNGQAITSPSWDPSKTVRYLGYEGQYCQGVLAGTDDGLWVLLNP